MTTPINTLQICIKGEKIRKLYYSTIGRIQFTINYLEHKSLNKFNSQLGTT